MASSYLRRVEALETRQSAVCVDGCVKCLAAAAALLEKHGVHPSASLRAPTDELVRRCCNSKPVVLSEVLQSLPPVDKERRPFDWEAYMRSYKEEQARVRALNGAPDPVVAKALAAALAELEAA